VTADDQALVPASHRIRAVLRLRDFRRLWLVMSFSSFGDWLGLLATTALAAELANGYAAANFALGGVLVVRLLPAVVFGPLPGLSPTGSTGASSWSPPTSAGSGCFCPFRWSARCGGCSSRRS
jgi:hypothetical protein